MILYEYYNDILKHPSNWDYYANHSDCLSIDKISTYNEKNIDEILDKDKAVDFIWGYFKAGKKINIFEDVLTDNDAKENLINRCRHMASAFFLGLVLAKLFSTSNDIYLSIGEEKFSFTYVWFLTCLYHDIGYIYEDDKCIQKELSLMPHSLSRHQQMKRQLKIGNTHRHNLKSLYDQLLAKALETETMEFHFGNDVINIHPVSHYEKDLQERYFKYIAVEFGKWDHGIVGGCLFLDRLIKNYVNNYKKPSESPKKLEDFNEQDLRFHYAQLPIFHYISQCIIAHNIWKAPEDKVLKYRYFGLDELIDDNFAKISIEKNPLLFILCLVDTLEPVKRIPKESKAKPTDVLKRIEIYYDDYPNEYRKLFCDIPIKRLIKINYQNEKENVIKLRDSLNSWLDTDAHVVDNSILLPIKYSAFD